MAAGDLTVEVVRSRKTGDLHLARPGSAFTLCGLKRADVELTDEIDASCDPCAVWREKFDKVGEE